MRMMTNYKESEKYIERYLNRKVEELGGISLKYSNLGATGYPDRVVLLPGGKTVWAELKSKGRKPSLIQSLRFEQMEAIGHHVFVCDSIEKVDKMLEDEI